MPFDEPLFRLIHHGLARCEVLNRLLVAAARFGSGAEIALMLLVGVRGGWTGWQAVGRCLIGVAIVYLTAEILGKLVRRARPFASNSAAQALIPHGPGRSFPSRHVASAVAMSEIVRSEAPGSARLMLLLSLALGIGRIRAALHYPSDVLAGAAIGYLIGRLCRRGESTDQDACG
jgi:undecaprenyl-diphosphatase